MAEIIRLIVPAYPDLEETERARIHSAVMAFVASQIESLPAHLSGPYRLAITLFGLLPLLRFGKRFALLDETVKEAYLSSWSDGPVGPTRDFVKLIRGCALLAYFDHPDVRRHLPAGPKPLATNVVETSEDVVGDRACRRIETVKKPDRLDVMSVSGIRIYPECN